MPAHPQSVIRAFTVRLQNHCGVGGGGGGVYVGGGGGGGQNA